MLVFFSGLRSEHCRIGVVVGFLSERLVYFARFLGGWGGWGGVDLFVGFFVAWLIRLHMCHLIFYSRLRHIRLLFRVIFDFIIFLSSGFFMFGFPPLHPITLLHLRALILGPSSFWGAPRVVGWRRGGRNGVAARSRRVLLTPWIFGSWLLDGCAPPTHNLQLRRAIFIQPLLVTLIRLLRFWNGVHLRLLLIQINHSQMLCQEPSIITLAG